MHLQLKRQCSTNVLYNTIWFYLRWITQVKVNVIIGRWGYLYFGPHASKLVSKVKCQICCEVCIFIQFMCKYVDSLFSSCWNRFIEIKAIFNVWVQNSNAEMMSDKNLKVWFMKHTFFENISSTDLRFYKAKVSSVDAFFLGCKIIGCSYLHVHR